MPASSTQHTVAAEGAHWQLAVVKDWRVYECRGGKALEQALVGIVGGEPLTANEARPIPGGTLLRTQLDGWFLFDHGLSGREDDISALLQAAETHGYVIDATEGYRLLRLAGDGVCALLARFCALDLRSKVFPPGTCPRAPVAQVPVVVHRSDMTVFTLICPTSYADYMALALRAGENSDRRA